jgi:hypothetical protein
MIAQRCEHRLGRPLFGRTPAATAAFEARRVRLLDRAHHVEYP